MAHIIEGLPKEPLFHYLLSTYRAYPNRILVDDQQIGVKADYFQFFTDVLSLRRKIREQLPKQMFDARGLISQDRPYVFIIATRAYDFIVAVYSAFALGAAIAPISYKLMPGEACHLLKTARTSCVLVSPEHQSEGSELTRHWLSTFLGPPPVMVSIETISIPLVPKLGVGIDEDMAVDPASPGALFFTSGTTGPPKGVVQSRQLWHQEPVPAPADEVWLHFRDPYWFGVAQRLVASVQAGVRILAAKENVAVIWGRFRVGDVTIFHAPPPMYAAMMTYFKQYIDCLGVEERSQYIDGVRRVRDCIISGGVSWPTVMHFWHELLGRPLRNLYGCTEAGCVTSVRDEAGATTDRCIGLPCKGVEIKLSYGDSGEILIKSGTVFIGYLGNEAATKAALDDDGYFKSGDFAHKVDGRYVIDGRASHDFIRFCGLRVPVHEVEAEIVSLAYVSEAYVVSTTFQYQRQIAILVKASSDTTAAVTSPIATEITLRRIREDLQVRGTLQQFKLPTLLRILPAIEAAPRTGTGKTDRKAIARAYFDIPEEGPLPEGVEFWDAAAAENNMPKRQMWDWGGMGVEVGRLKSSGV